MFKIQITDLKIMSCYLTGNFSTDFLQRNVIVLVNIKVPLEAMLSKRFCFVGNVDWLQLMIPAETL